MNLTIDPDGYVIFEFETTADLAAFCRRIPADTNKVLNPDFHTLTIKISDLDRVLTINLGSQQRWKMT